MKDDKRTLFKSKWGFIIACVGSAVGMANVWGFSYKLGSNGGGAFLIAYLCFVFIFSYVGLSAEYAIGRLSGTGPLGSYARAWRDFKFKKIGKVIGYLPLLGSVCIAIGYAVIISYVLKALADSLSGVLMNVNPENWFNSFAFKNYSVLWYHVLIIVITGVTLIIGTGGIEKSNKIMMPFFFFLFVILAIRVALLPNASDGYKFLFTPEWEKLKDPMTWVWAMGQAFFSLSITGSGMIVYGSYLSKDEDIVYGAKNTAIFDTLAALVAALVMIPAAFAFSLDPGGGPGLLFVTLPTVLQSVPAGGVFAVILYTAVVFGGITSLQNMFEVVVESILYKFEKLNRRTVLIALCIITFAVGVFMEPIAETEGTIMGGWGNWMDLVSIYIIPIGASIGALSWFWILDKQTLLDEINVGAAKKQGERWHFIGKWIYTPLSIILCITALTHHIAF